MRHWLRPDSRHPGQVSPLGTEGSPLLMQTSEARQASRRRKGRGAKAELHAVPADAGANLNPPGDGALERDGEAAGVVALLSGRIGQMVRNGKQKAVTNCSGQRHSNKSDLCPCRI